MRQTAGSEAGSQSIVRVWRDRDASKRCFPRVWCRITSHAMIRYEAAKYKKKVYARGSRQCQRGTEVAETPSETNISMLGRCCEDKVRHKEEARDCAAEGPFPWFPWIDLQQVGNGLCEQGQRSRQIVPREYDILRVIKLLCITSYEAACSSHAT